MKLSKSQKSIYTLLSERGELTTREIDSILFMTRSSMRISEINRAYNEEHGKPLIVTIRKKPNGEHVKGLAERLKKPKSTFTYNSEKNCMEEVVSLVEV